MLITNSKPSKYMDNREEAVDGTEPVWGGGVDSIVPDEGSSYKIGRASWRERGEISGVAVSLKKKKE